MLDPNMSIEFVLVILVSTLLALFAMTGVLIYAIVKVRKDPYPIMLTLTLAILTLVAILTFALTKQNVLATLAGAGLGALAGSLTNQFSSKTNHPSKPEEGDTNANSTEQHPGHDEEASGPRP